MEMAMLHYAEQHADAVVLEVGMGGRLDATNIVVPTLSVRMRLLDGADDRC